MTLPPGTPHRLRTIPPHVDEDVFFDFNNAELLVPAESINLILTKIKAGSPNDVMDLALNVMIALVGGTIISDSYDYLSDAPGRV